jgi:hypothetical protein
MHGDSYIYVRILYVGIDYPDDDISVEVNKHGKDEYDEIIKILYFFFR